MRAKLAASRPTNGEQSRLRLNQCAQGWFEFVQRFRQHPDNEFVEQFRLIPRCLRAGRSLLKPLPNEIADDVESRFVDCDARRPRLQLGSLMQRGC